jgi:hypothetical protein
MMAPKSTGQESEDGKQEGHETITEGMVNSCAIENETPP